MKNILLIMFAICIFSENVIGQTLKGTDKQSVNIDGRNKTVTLDTLMNYYTPIRTAYNNFATKDSTFQFNESTVKNWYDNLTYETVADLKAATTTSKTKAIIPFWGEYSLFNSGRNAITQLSYLTEDESYIIPNESGGTFWFKSDSQNIIRPLFHDTWYQNVSYIDTASQTRFNMYMPSWESKQKGLFVFYPGGGFNSNDENYTKDIVNDWDFPAWRDSLVDAGFAFITVGYTYSMNDTSGVKRCLEDGQNALKYLIDNQSKYLYNTDFIVLAGNSAGAYVASYVALEGSYNVDAVVCLNGFATLDFQKWTNEVFDSISPTLLSYNLDYQLDLVDKGGELKIESWLNIDYADYFDLRNTYLRQQIDLLNLVTANSPTFYWANTLEADTSPVNFQAMRHHPRHCAYFKSIINDLGGDTTYFYYSPFGRSSVVEFVKTMKQQQ
jgi:pimeloyl-ACP methyl ester carboxylesterase